MLCEKAAQFNSNILLQGESGGKERFAEYIFEKSYRNNKAFIKINCASIPENLLESELFGYEPGAFSGADSKGKKVFLNMLTRALFCWMRSASYRCRCRQNC